jgi:hypothetical protein
MHQSQTRQQHQVRHQASNPIALWLLAIAWATNLLPGSSLNVSNASCRTPPRDPQLGEAVEQHDLDLGKLLQLLSNSQIRNTSIWESNSCYHCRWWWGYDKHDNWSGKSKKHRKLCGHNLASHEIHTNSMSALSANGFSALCTSRMTLSNSMHAPHQPWW